MADTRYFVRFFERDGDALVGLPPSAMRDHLAAIGEALRRAQEDAAGAIVFARSGGKIEIILRVGDAPETMDAPGAGV